MSENTIKPTIKSGSTIGEGFIAKETQPRSESVEITTFTNGARSKADDYLTIEEPLEILVCGKNIEEQTLAITMRTPGQDNELALGFLFTEGVITSASDVISLEHCRPPSPDGIHNAIRAELAPNVKINHDELQRHFLTTSSCGVCGKTSIDAVMRRKLSPIGQTFQIESHRILSLPEVIRTHQQEFALTGAIHACATFDTEAQILDLREDVGRHNAMDKLVGHLLLTQRLPLRNAGVLLSGRASFELLQKAAMAGAELVAAIGPPSSLARRLAQENAITLTGFHKPDGFNIYSSPKRIQD